MKKTQLLFTGLLAAFILAGQHSTPAQTIPIGPGPITPPAVTILDPTNGEVFYTPTNITLVAEAITRSVSNNVTLDFNVTNVQFFAGTNFLGSVSIPPRVIYPPGSPQPLVIIEPVFFFVWSNAPVGSQVLTAVARDVYGLTAISAPVTITVLPGPPPPTNPPPVVHLTSPPDQAVFRAPVDIPLYAYAFAPGGTVTNVEFFANSTDLGPSRSLLVPVPIPLAATTTGGAVISPEPAIPVILPVSDFALVWTNAPAGTNVLTAVAANNQGTMTTSAPVNVTILPPIPPPTNRPVIVNIVATDPVAVEGTNCWLTPVPVTVPPVPSWSNWPPSAIRFATNCGPKNAAFTVRRFGDTNDVVTVTYAIGGTASNGMDYATLPGAVTVPAGQRSALIPVVPIDDGLPDINKTVILTLISSTNTPPDYLLGLPRRAAALIVDRGNPYPVPVVLPDKSFHLAAAGPDGAWFHVEYSTDLATWLPVCTNQVVGGVIDFIDPDAAAGQQRFYRAVPENNPPSD